MRFLIYLTLLIGLVAGCSCSDEKEFGQICLEESDAWRAFTEVVGDEIKRNNLFESYFSLRAKRLTISKDVECPKEMNGRQVEVFHDADQAHSKLCAREKSLEAYSRVCNDGFIRKKIKKMVLSYREFRNRLKQQVDCGELEVSISEVKELLIKHKEQFYESCKVEETYDRITHKVTMAIKDFKADMSPLDEARDKLRSAAQFREEFCVGSTRDCCGDDIVDEAAIVSIIGTAELLLRMTRGLVEPFKDQLAQEREAEDWDGKFKKLCQLERKIDAIVGRQNQEFSTHGLAHRNRSKLGKALGQQSCPADELAPLEKVVKSATIDRCEEEIKPKLMCDALIEAKTLNNGPQESLNNLQTFWCKKEEKLLMAKESVKKVYKPTVCSDQVVSVITGNAKLETVMLLELLELEKTSERASELSKNIADGFKHKLRTLRHLKKVLRMDVNDNSDAVARKESHRAFMLISDELERLENSDEIKKSKLPTFLAPAWPKWFKL